MDVFVVFVWIILLVILYKAFDVVLRIPEIEIAGKNVFVTGSDSGFGRALAIQLDKKGANVFAGCFTESGETELKKKCSSRLRTIHIDVTKEESIKQAVEKVKSDTSSTGGLWGLVNNAGVGAFGLIIEGLSRQDYMNPMRVNLFGVIDTTVAFLPLIRKSKGRIVNVASMAGRYSFATMAAYTLSKYGVEAFSDALRNELKHLGVSVHIVEPGYFRTSLTCIGKRKTWQDLDQEIIKDYGEDFLKKALYVYTDAKRDQVDNPAELSAVVNAYEHALFGQFPRARYVVGWDAKFALKLLTWLPEWLADWITSYLFFNTVNS